MSFGIETFRRLEYVTHKEHKEVFESSILRMRNIFYSATLKDHPWQTIIHVCGYFLSAFSWIHLSLGYYPQFWSRVRSSKKSSDTQGLLRNTLSDYILATFQGLMSCFREYLILLLPFHSCPLTYFFPPRLSWKIGHMD